MSTEEYVKQLIDELNKKRNEETYFAGRKINSFATIIFKYKEDYKPLNEEDIIQESKKYPDLIIQRTKDFPTTDPEEKKRNQKQKSLSIYYLSELKGTEYYDG